MTLTWNVTGKAGPLRWCWTFNVGARGSAPDTPVKVPGALPRAPTMRKQDLHKLTDYLWEIPTSYRADMRVPARVYTSERMLDSILGDRSLDQLVNVATLPGLQRYVIAMPDVHEGYGFPIGGVAAVDATSGVISPGGIGYDINCGVRMLRSDATLDEVKP